MQNMLTLLDPVTFAKAEAEKQIGNSLDVAHEIYLVRQCASIHYADLMNDVPSGTVSKDMLLAWIRDYPSREGLIALYMRYRPQHFENDGWMARYFAQFIEFAKSKLTDKSFVGSKKKAELFAVSFDNEVWKRKACAVLGLRMIEEMYKRRKLKSREANQIMFVNFQNRELLQSVGHIVGRVAKNNGLDSFESSDVTETINNHFKTQWKHWRQNPTNETEIKMLEQFEFAIERTMTTLFHPQALLETAATHE